MTQSNSSTCARVCWLVAVAIGLIVFALLMKMVSTLLSLASGAIVAVGLARFLTKKYCAGTAAEAAPTAAPAAAPTAAPAETPVEAPAEAPTEAPAAEAAPQAPAAEADDAGAAVKSSQLPGQVELAARKGTWTYGEGSGAAAAPAAEAAGDDDLKMLKGVGAKLEQKLHDAGVTSFAQIAAWGEEDITRMDDVLSFKGRIARDGWVAQAKTLAAGGDTEFSKRVEDGGVYED